jgi:hypothetical protein
VREPLLPVLRYWFAPLLSPMLMLPAFLIGLRTRPFQLVSLVVATGLVYVSDWLAIAAAAGYMLFLGGYLLVEVRRRRVLGLRTAAWSYVSSFVFTGGLVVAFVASLIWLEPLWFAVRWLAALAIAYYVAALSASYVVALGASGPAPDPARRRS